MEVKRPLGANWIITASEKVVNSGKATSVKINGKQAQGFRTKLSNLLLKDGSVRIAWE